MTIHYKGHGVTLHHGDCLDVLRTLPDASVDSVVTDPPYGLGFMGKEWDDLPPGLPFAAECLRVLKPGGHLLAFGGTRTWHRLACAVEDAGFEVRDSIAWMYGSGFPKSLDVSKAIDKAAGAEREVTGRTVTPFRVDNAATRGTSLQGSVNGDFSRQSEDGYRYTEHTAPATPDAERWQGWGTALKPAFEPVVVARKPLKGTDVNVLEMVESELRNRLGVKEIRWTSGPASGAAKHDPRTSSSSTEAPRAAATSADPADASETPSDARPIASGSVRTIKPGGTPTSSTSVPITASKTASSETTSSTPMAASAPAAESDSTSSSLSTTSTAAEPLTGRQSTARSMPSSDERATRPAIESFAGIATGLTGSRAHALIERLPDGSFVWPEGLAKFVKGGPLTVAANVLAWGTGALNIDACRIGTGGEKIHVVQSDPRKRQSSSVRVSPQDDVAAFRAAQAASIERTNTLGRWPTNVILDESQAAELDRQSGTLSHNPPATFVNGTAGAEGWGGIGKAEPGQARSGFGDAGGASRFFYVAKADATERPRVNGTAHPTVKPLSLMRWLVRLVTPPGGTVLEPFAGSGTTVEACIVEGFDCIAIEKGDEYLPLIMQRIHRRRDPVAAIRQTGDELGLFELDGEGA